MENESYYTTDVTTLRQYFDKTLRTTGCMLMFCTEGRAIVECNFTRMKFRKGDVAVIFSDTLVSVSRISPGFCVKFFELSSALADDVTLTSAGEFFDWIYEYPIFTIPPDKRLDISLWLTTMERIEHIAERKHRITMLRNMLQTFFLGLESALKHHIANQEIKTFSSSRRLFNEFYKLLSENCKQHHDVKFYADKLCITPYYLSRITRQIFSASPKELIDRQIIMEIKALLTTTELSVKEIAASYNFESSSYLGRFFRRHIGMTPSEYREQKSSE